MFMKSVAGLGYILIEGVSMILVEVFAVRACKSIVLTGVGLFFNSEAYPVPMITTSCNSVATLERRKFNSVDPSIRMDSTLEAYPINFDSTTNVPFGRLLIT